ncbi:MULTISPECIES: TfoX/Sxy family DNA transformation protein [Mannheimia]|uniref:TfoX/Sxy family DNA transformation protein n=1 Tax=Mannheimia pernigra TaxID=111844 RepID=A0ABD7A6F3_9PAST|nr:MULTISPECIES: TfoX/Sxy family DNA transformation protein [Mannheimia]QHB16874.1 DNA transformation protein [Mannheimia pernigra]QLB41671.1 TfoX/Sxy family DNA transformation protein [Mannheimia pernigra]QLB43809.1 TfoX/Sxy family DNA transformation protein [Mannheimia pernigra]QTM01097.1 DNA transformation protein [Mannheimia sp. ZY171111]
MKTVNEIRQEIAPVFEPVLGEFRIKTYFSYYAIFKHNLMIALYQNGTTYLRISRNDMQSITLHPETYNLSDDKIGLQSKKFYFIPNTILTNTSQFRSLVQSTLDELQSEKQKIDNKRSTQIRTLPNMNLKLERMLKKVGIHSIQDFSETGYISTFIKLIMQGFDATEDLLFKLNGALNHQYIYTFTIQQKKELLQEANEALYASGLRKKFNTAI